MQYSPRVWGCFHNHIRDEGYYAVFPTRVGVFLDDTTPKTVVPSIPHACGGVSRDAHVIMGQ